MKKRTSDNNIPWDSLILHLKGEGTATDERQLAEWAAQGDNSLLLDELTDLWEKIQHHAGGYTPDKAYYWNELSKRLKLNGSQPVATEKTESPTTAPTRRTVPFYRNWRNVAAAACAGLLIACSFLIGQRLAQPADFPLQYTNVSGKSRATLPDHSHVWLHTRTTLACDIAPGDPERIVRLQGEAFFDVAHDPDRPFIVQTGDVQIRVHGTRFNVEAFPDEENIYVSLEQGSVSLATPADACFLRPGEMATYNKADRSLNIEKTDIAFHSLWTKDELLFQQHTLQDICRTLEKWYNVRIVLSGSIGQAYRFTFSLRNEPLEEILRLMASVHPIGYTYRDGDEISIYPQPKDNKLPKQ